MPLIHIQTSAASPADAGPLLRELTRELAALLGKPERYVMTLLKTDLAMTFGGDDAPCAYVEIKSLGGLDGEQPRRLSRAISELLGRQLCLDAARIYIAFEDAPARLWGWNGSTFG